MANVFDGPLPVVVMGLGSIGQEIARAALASPALSLVGAVDSNPHLVGKNLGEVIGHAGTRLKVAPELPARPSRGRGASAVLLHATGSRLPKVADQLISAAEAGFSVISTCEELAYPFVKHPALSEKLDKAAARAGVSI